MIRLLKNANRVQAKAKNGECQTETVIFSIDLENKLRSHRNFSFARFESEQLNKLSGIIPSLQDDYRLTIDEKAVGLAFLPIGSEEAQPLMKLV